MPGECRAGRDTRQARRSGRASYNRAVGGNELRDLLNRLRWGGAGDAGAVAVEICERSEEGEAVRALGFAAVAEILPAGVTLADGTFIPYHRVLSVRRGDEVLWRAGRRHHGEA
jgi:uncharacterized protein (UPF0248 family)